VETVDERTAAVDRSIDPGRGETSELWMSKEGRFSMPTEPWFVLTVAAMSLSLAIAGPLAAWFVFKYRQARFERLVERRFVELNHQFQAIRARLEPLEGIVDESTRVPQTRPRWSGPSWPTTDPQRRRDSAATRVDGGEPPLIAVPNLAAAANDREVVVNGLTQRYAAIWSLAASGSSAEVIARATGQPIGQIELILGLRRQIDGTRTTIPHAPHS
jgi:hypothetical protein